MLDHRLFATQPADVIARLKRRGVDQKLVDTLTRLVESRSQAIQRLDALRHQLKEASDAVSQKARAGDQAAVAAARESLKSLKAEIKAGEDTEAAAQSGLEKELLLVPNLPDDSVPDGEGSAQNRVERLVGEKPQFAFAPKPHWEVGEKLGILDFERAAKISGARFAILRGFGARLERALVNFMLDVQREHGYTEVWPPLLVHPEAMQGAGQYPKFIGESFETQDREFVLIPTAEVPLVNMHADEIIDEAALPLRYTAYTPCFRREAGAAGKDTRGLIRQHQFNKVELVSFCTPEQSQKEHERLTGHAEAILQRLGLHYRVVALCTGDLGFAAMKTYDLEVWLPGQDTYREISSCSNCGDFQARRAKVRYRPKDGGDKAKPRLLHTLNGSGLAVGRTLVALLENGQQADGSLKLPEALVPYVGQALLKAAE